MINHAEWRLVTLQVRGDPLEVDVKVLHDVLVKLDDENQLKLMSGHSLSSILTTS